MLSQPCADGPGYFQIQNNESFPAGLGVARDLSTSLEGNYSPRHWGSWGAEGGNYKQGDWGHFEGS